MTRRTFTGLLLLILASQASAYLYRFDEQNYYARVFGGLTWSQQTQMNYTAASSNIHVHYHPAGNFGFNLGYRSNHWRIEYEFTHMKAAHKTMNLDHLKLDESGALLLNSHMANLLYNFADEFYATIPYFGAGMGVTHLHQNGYKYRYSSTVVGGSATDNEFTWQGMIGIAYYLNKNTAVDIEYRHIATSEAHETIDHEYHGNSLLLGAAYHWL